MNILFKNCLIKPVIISVVKFRTKGILTETTRSQKVFILKLEKYSVFLSTDLADVIIFKFVQ